MKPIVSFFDLHTPDVRVLWGRFRPHNFDPTPNEGLKYYCEQTEVTFVENHFIVC